MIACIRYFWYVVRHRWFVLLECWKWGLLWRGIMHDLSKFRPSEFLPYAAHFYGPRARQRRDSTGYYKPEDTGDAAFDLAWFFHQRRNDHHWQWWILPTSAGGLAPRRMPWKAALEMVCDWRGAARAQGTASVQQWYDAHKDEMTLDPGTRGLVEAELSGVGTAEMWRGLQ